MMPTVALYTLGCKVSLYETEAITEAFVKEGYKVCGFDEVCDVYVINTCTVTAESDAKSRKYIRRAIRKNPQAVVIAIGCYSQHSPEEVAGIDGVSAVIGTADKLSAVKLASELLKKKADSPIISVKDLSNEKFESMTVTSAPRTRAYVKIEDGCECKCTYCAISPARGPVRSKPACEVIREVEGLFAGGTKEVILTGIETGSYGADFDEKYDLADLLTELNERHSCERIRLGSMAPELLSESFISRVYNLPILTPHFHISMQSGSTAVLNRMKRRYSYEMAIKNVNRIREKIPSACLTADLMVGFPGESEDDFLATVKFVKEARLLDAHVFAYSKRSGTPAASYDGQIPEEIKKERSARLIKEVAISKEAVLSDIISSGRTLPCIFETKHANFYTGHSDSYIEVMCQSDEDIRGRLLTVLPTHQSDGILYGRIISK